MKTSGWFIRVCTPGALAALLLLAACAQGEQGDTGPAGPPGSGLLGSISGRAVLFGEDDSSGIEVSAVGSGAKAVTGPGGHFALKNLAEGAYELKASLAPYQPRRFANVTVSGGSASEVDFLPLKLGRRLNETKGELKYLTADGRRVIFLECYNQNRACLVYSQATDGSSAPELIDMDVYLDNFQLAPDGSRVVYLKNGDLYSNPVDHGAPALLDNTLYTYAFAISPDSRFVVYRKPTATGSLVLFSCPIDHSAPIEIDAEVYSFQITADSARVVYTDSSYQLFSNPLDSFAPLLLALNVETFRATPDGLRVVYIDWNYSLYTTPPGAASPVLIETVVGNTAITPDSLRLVYIKNGNLYSSPIKVKAPLLVESAFNINSPFGITPDSSRVVYWKGAGFYSASITSFDPVWIDDDVQSFRILYDSARVLYIKNNFDLMSSPMGVGAPVQLDSLVISLLASKDSSRAVYMNKGSELRSCPVDRGEPAVLDQWVDAYPYLITPDNRRVIYWKSSTLYFRAIDASKKARAIDDNDLVGATLLPPDGSFLIYSRYRATYPLSLDNGIIRLDFPEGW